jgi:amidophosphoribosyltransferase
MDQQINLDALHEECGVFGIYGQEDAAAHCTLGLHALQHRGQEAAGMVTCHNGEFFTHHDVGYVGDIFNKVSVIDKLKGSNAIGHVRYSTAGKKSAANFQPIFAELELGDISLAHNGNLTNANDLRQKLIKKGAIFKSSMDTEVILHLIAQSKAKTIADRIIDALNQIKGAYSILIMTNNSIYAIRDPHGVRPLSLGKLNDSYVIASESCAFDINGAKLIRDIQAGEMVVIDNNGLNSYSPFKKKPSKFCVFEYIYFSRPDTIINNQYIYNIRKNIGKFLAKESSVDADIIVPVPDSGVPAALGYANQTGIDFEFGIIRNHYVGRTFIEPTDQVRNLGVKLKHNANKSVLEGKRVILVDDSIVRGTTSKKIVNMVRAAGAKEVHMRISSPPTTNSCFYGVDTPERSKLISASHSNIEIANLIGVDSLEFISLDGLYKAIGEKERNNKEAQFCDACFSGQYPIELTDHNKA